MDILGFLGTLVSGGLGGVVGAAGAVAGKILDIKVEDAKRETRKLELDHDLVMRDKDMALMRLEAEGKLQLAQVDADSHAQQADWGALAKAEDADKATYSTPGDSALLRFVDFARGMVRPLLTAWAAALVGVTAWQAMPWGGGPGLTPAFQSQMVNDAQFLAGLAIAYWFGSRPNRK